MRSFKVYLAFAFLLVTFPVQGLSQKRPAVNMEQYLFPEFSECTIRSKAGTISHEIANYNTITGKMAFMKDSLIYGIPTIIQADTVIINNRRFVPFGENFYEVLLEAPIPLFVHHESRLTGPGQPVGYGTSKLSKVNTYVQEGTSRGVYSLDIPADYEIRYLPVFWIRLDGNMHSFINRSQLTKLLPGRKKEIERFIKAERIRMSDPEEVKKVVEYCNELY